SYGAVGDLGLRLVVEGQSQRAAEGHQRPFHTVCLTLFHCALMRCALVAVDARAVADALTDDAAAIGLVDSDPYLADVGYAPPLAAAGQLGRGLAHHAQV